MSSSDPRFYKSDMVSILQEKNELKEKVLELEEEVKTLRMLVYVNLASCSLIMNVVYWLAVATCCHISNVARLFPSVSILSGKMQYYLYVVVLKSPSNRDSRWFPIAIEVVLIVLAGKWLSCLLKGLSYWLQALSSCSIHNQMHAKKNQQKDHHHLWLYWKNPWSMS